MEKKNVLLILLILGTAFWGISFSVTKLAMGSQSPNTFLFYRFLMATLVLSIIFWKHLVKTDIVAIKTGAILAIPLFLGIQLQTLGIQNTPASQCAFIAGTSVVIVPLFKLMLYRKAAPFKIWIAATVALIGLFVISVNGQLTIGTGDLYTIAGAFCFAAYLILVEQQASKKSLVPTIIPMFATCTLLTFGLSLGDAQANWFPESDTFWIGIVFCGLFSTAYMYSISNIAQRYISAERVAVIYLFEPVFGAIAAFFILDENLTWRLLLGGALIFIATLISEVNFKKKSLQRAV
ncbi:DMT family transporter [Pedobacter sp.]|uniref:DMT family transporter n=1 Tax=Pedobacter sp. TaxID=1411316 RepID=UPI0031E47728